MKEFENITNTAWDNKDSINGQSDQSILSAIKDTVELVDNGTLRVAEKKDNEWIVHQWIKKAILLSFKTNEMQTLAGPYATWWDKVRGKTAGWGREEHKKAQEEEKNKEIEDAKAAEQAEYDAKSILEKHDIDWAKKVEVVQN